MFLSEPQSSSYDWRFQLFGFPVRVTWLFWAFSAAFGYTQARGLHDSFTAMNVPSNFALLLLIWVLCSFVSILVHELGHALAFRYFGIDAEIVLYQMGGLAIPGAGLLWARQGRRTRLTHANHLVISAAGPAIQIALGVLVGAIAIDYLCHPMRTRTARSTFWSAVAFGGPSSICCPCIHSMVVRLRGI